MNLLLYAEARNTLARQQGERIPARLPTIWNATEMALPDSLFEELGYYGALDEDETTETDGDDSLDELFRHLAQSVHSF
jgi:hypothetical protein